ncbi:hypothetical protein [Microbulbifer pacificus]|uniref:DUF2975 domain-containing protein n=1 Tax=Microbulbifer pacificus TaxID=407164 RepID=A0AAU0MYD9_9GAMM|nr:hypothetical protein [Microbulbifer pacificus]WOX05514.1 hypothetical protein R5R33_17515 [Microbulbifer pacificus]
MKPILSKSSKLARDIFHIAFSIAFLAICAIIIIYTTYGLFTFLLSHQIFDAKNDLPAVVLNAISNLVVALAIFELQMAISIEARKPMTSDIVHALKIIAPRFIMVISVALMLEGLILVIKYGQAENISNLYFPVAVILGAGFLLIALGTFLKLCPDRGIELE